MKPKNKQSWLVRAHIENDTLEELVDSEQAAKSRAHYLIANGIWRGNRLYPPSSIIFIEIYMRAD